MKRILFLVYFFYFNTGFCQNITFLNFPSNNQLYPRNVITNNASILINGNVNQTSGFSNLTLEIYRDSNLYNSVNLNLIYTNGVANFQFNTSIVSELKNYSFKLYNNNTLLKESNNIVAGDLYLFQGQSNMRGQDTSNSSSLITNFIRSFGKFPVDIQNNSWFINDYIGGVAKSFAIQLISEHNRPVAIINGALGGINISAMQRNDSNPSDPTTNYGLMLSRFLSAGFTPADVKAMIFYQGESNSANSILSYKNLFYQLKSDWDEDFSPPYYYIFQVHKGCGVTESSFQYEAQRQISNEVSNLKLISTNGVPQGTDLCHFLYNDAYSVFGSRLYNLINYDIYNSGNNSGIYSPTIENIRFSNSEFSEIKFDLVPASASYTLDSGVESSFFLSPANTVTVTNSSISGNTVRLSLSGSFYNSNPKLSYLGTNPNASPTIKNQNGIGLINFKDLQINTPSLITIDENNWTYFYYESDLINPIFGIEKNPIGIGANSSALNNQITISDHISSISKTNGKEASFVLGKWWNMTSLPIPNGWVNIRFFYQSILESSLLNTAINYKNSNGSSYISPVMFIQTDQYLNPFNQLNYNGFIIPIKKCGTSTTTGSYNGNSYAQFNQVQLNSTTGGTAIVKVTNFINLLAPGTIRFDASSGKFQGWNGSNWLNFN